MIILRAPDDHLTTWWPPDDHLMALTDLGGAELGCAGVAMRYVGKQTPPVQVQAPDPEPELSGPVTLRVPCDLYGLFVAEPLQLNVQVDGHMVVGIEIARLTMFMIGSMLTQLTLIAQLHHISVEHHGNQCLPTHPYVQMTCVGVFGLMMLQEILDGIDFAKMLWKCPVSEAEYLPPDAAQMATVVEGQGALLRMQPQRKSVGLLSRLANGARWRRKPPTDEHVWTLTSMSSVWWRVCLLFAALRLGISVLMMIVGAGYISRADKYQIILQTVNTFFIVNVPTLLFNACSSRAVKEHLQKMKGLEIQPTQAENWLGLLLDHVIYPILLFAFVLGSVWSARSKCPDGLGMFETIWKYSWFSFIGSVFQNTIL
eukprot:TRINITY_DN97421_c0_g1_i1.p1 TRINITY_DN97421_c0_g1~~TRINITY_DN97421_c0_g1_i1.p1  ORF type:complete len:371 (-),score=50.01 TRINITY_DN97421_c0_g1_i1:190-1302(-)